MKSVQTRAAEVCRKLGLPVIENENGVAYQIILDALQEYGQEREHAMRHACAEAILKLEPGAYSGGAIDADAAHAACMNAKVE